MENQDNETAEPSPTDPAGSDNDPAGGLVLYQWPTSRYCDSIYTRCTKIQRLMGLLKISYKVADISLPDSQEEEAISEKINPLMRQIPIIKAENDAYIKETPQIVRYLLERSNAVESFGFENARQKSTAELLEFWVANWLEWLVIYARWKRTENYHRFAESFTKPSDLLSSKKSRDYTRNRAVGILDTKEVGELNEKQYFNEVNRSLDILNGLLKESSFFGGDSIKEADLSVFMCIQALVDPSLKMERLHVVNRTNLCKWALKVDKMTATPSTQKLADF